jgi:hypothetical protein
MNRNTEIQKKVDDVMESLSGIERLEPADFFYTRVQGRLMNQRKNVWESLARTVTRPVFAFASISLIVLVNSFVILSVNASLHKSERSEIAIADEYRSANSFYDLENVMP